MTWVELPRCFYAVQKIKDMVVENGARWWLVAWAGANENGEPFNDTWEPTSSLTPLTSALSSFCFSNGVRGKCAPSQLTLGHSTHSYSKP